jgi:HPt (histidine-containing phosphotransfer) domain-containing protein
MDNEFFNDPEFQALIGEYLNHLKSSIPEVQIELKNQNFEKVRKFGHNLKGTGTGYGYEEFTNLGKTIEQYAIDQKTDTLDELLDKLEKLVQEAHEKFHSNK